MHLSLSPTWNTGNGRFDHYLPVSLPSAGTTCYYRWCATMTGQGHSRKLTHISKKREKKRRSTAMSLAGVCIQTCPYGGITMTTSSVGKTQVYFSKFGFQLASATAMLAGVRIRIHTNRQFGFRSPWLYVCRMWEETSWNPCDQRENISGSESEANKLTQVHLFDLLGLQLHFIQHAEKICTNRKAR